MMIVILFLFKLKNGTVSTYTIEKTPSSELFTILHSFMKMHYIMILVSGYSKCITHFRHNEMQCATNIMAQQGSRAQPRHPQCDTGTGAIQGGIWW